MEDETLKKALRSASTMLSKRSHSVKELKTKLIKKYPSEYADKAIAICRENNWLESEEDLAEKLIKTLHEKKKSWFYIQNYFREKGLPLPDYDRQKELEKAQALVDKKFPEISAENEEKIKQFLSYRGFSKDIVMDIL